MSIDTINRRSKESTALAVGEFALKASTGVLIAVAVMVVVLMLSLWLTPNPETAFQMFAP